MTRTAQPPFDAFHHGAARRLLRYAFGLTGDVADAHGLVQEAYARPGSAGDG